MSFVGSLLTNDPSSKSTTHIARLMHKNALFARRLRWKFLSVAQLLNACYHRNVLAFSTFGF